MTTRRVEWMGKPIDVTQTAEPTNVLRGEPTLVSNGALPNQFQPRKDTLPETTPMLTAFQDLQTQREQRDTAVWDALWQALDPKLRSSVKETAHDLAEAEQALTGARAQLADLDSRQPSKAADVPKWAQKRGEVAGMISAYETLVHGARQAYEQTAQTVLVTAKIIMSKRWHEAEAAHGAAEVEYRRRKDAARAYLAEQNEARDAIRRLHAKVASGDVDLFR